jgi:predicted nucleic acid-binding protein
MPSLKVVVDANLAIPLVLDTPISDRADRLWAAWKKNGVEAVAPYLWIYEVTSALHKIYMLRQIDEKSAQSALDTLLSLGITLVSDDCLLHEAFNWATKLGRLAVYDCFYLVLAKQIKADFWTADKALYHAAHQAGAAWVRWFADAAKD